MMFVDVAVIETENGWLNGSPVLDDPRGPCTWGLLVVGRASQSGDVCVEYPSSDFSRRPSFFELSLFLFPLHRASKVMGYILHRSISIEGLRERSPTLNTLSRAEF